MNASERPSSRRRAGYLVAGALISALLISGIFLSRGLWEPVPRDKAANIVWDVPRGVVPPGDEQPVRDAVGAMRLTHTAGDDASISITQATVSGEWAVLLGEEKAAAQRPAQPTGAFEILGRKTKTGWQITTPNDPDFCRVLQQAPDSMIAKDYYIGCPSQ